MALTCETGTFAKETSDVDGTTQEVTTGFTPKALILWGDHSQTTDATSDGNVDYGYGFSDGTTHMSHGLFYSDDVTIMALDSSMRNDSVIHFTFAGATVVARASVSFDTNKFTLTWDVSSAVASKIHYIIYGGTDITDVDVNTSLTETSTGNKSYTSIANANDDEAILFLGMSPLLTINSFLGAWLDSFGMASSPTNEVAYAFRDAGSTTSDTVTEISSDSCIFARTNTTTVFMDVNFVNWTSTGFDLNWAVTNGTARHFIWMAINGGKWEVGTDSSKTSTGTKATTTAFEPVGLLNVHTVLSALDTGSDTLNLNYIMGGTDGTSEEAGGFLIEDAQAVSDCSRTSSITKCAMSVTNNQVVLEEADISSFNATDFTLDWTTADATARFFIWAVCGSGDAATKGRGYLI